MATTYKSYCPECGEPDYYEEYSRPEYSVNMYYEKCDNCGYVETNDEKRVS